MERIQRRRNAKDAECTVRCRLRCGAELCVCKAHALSLIHIYPQAVDVLDDADAVGGLERGGQIGVADVELLGDCLLYTSRCV